MEDGISDIWGVVFLKGSGLIVKVFKVIDVFKFDGIFDIIILIWLGVDVGVLVFK